MVKAMKNILLEFAYGNINPSVGDIKKGLKYERLNNSAKDKETLLLSALEGEIKEIFIKYTGEMTEATNIAETDKFILGYRLGVLMTGSFHRRRRCHFRSGGVAIMDYTKDAFARTKLQYIRTFILEGAELVNISDEPYHVRLKKVRKPIFNRLREVIANEDELEKAEHDLSHALANYEDVSIELGMKIGAKLLYQLLLSDEQLSAKLK